MLHENTPINLSNLLEKNRYAFNKSCLLSKLSRRLSTNYISILINGVELVQKAFKKMQNSLFSGSFLNNCHFETVLGLHHIVIEFDKLLL